MICSHPSRSPSLPHINRDPSFTINTGPARPIEPGRTLLKSVDGQFAFDRRRSKAVIASGAKQSIVFANPIVISANSPNGGDVWPRISKRQEPD
jgi:hypothetical protein